MKLPTRTNVMVSFASVSKVKKNEPKVHIDIKIVVKLIVISLVDSDPLFNVILFYLICCLPTGIAKETGNTLIAYKAISLRIKKY